MPCGALRHCSEKTGATLTCGLSRGKRRRSGVSRAHRAPDLGPRFPQRAGTVLWIDCGKLPDKLPNPLIQKNKEIVA
jgi:hypothetical protein